MPQRCGGAPHMLHVPQLRGNRLEPGPGKTVGLPLRAGWLTPRGRLACAIAGKIARDLAEAALWDARF